MVKNKLKKLITKIRYGDPYAKASDQQYILIHIPKTGGNAISEALWGVQDVGHWTVTDFARFDPERFKSLEKVAVMREPLERLHSAFEFLKKGGRSKKDTEYIERTGLANWSFADLVDFLSKSKNLEKEHIHFRPQSMFLCIEEVVCVDKIINFNNFNDGVKRVFGDSVADNLRIINQGPNSKRCNYEVELVEKVERIYESDFEIYKRLAN